MNKLKKALLVMGYLFGVSSMEAATITWTGGDNSSVWNNVSNWSGGVPSTSDDVIIPAGLSWYPTAEKGSSCRYIYMESGARIGGQELLNYEKAFVDLTLPTNRYVRIIPPTREVYTGDLFTEEQGGIWDNFSESSIASATSGTSANRVFPGATYISLFASNGTNYDADMAIEYRETTTSWAVPFNALAHRFNEGESFDVWVDNDNKDDATFHFPGGDEGYYYFRDNGTMDTERESISRTDNRFRFLFDSKSISSTGYYDRTFAANGTAMFATGNPSLGLMSIKLFMEQNVEAKYITPFLYRHINGEANADGHGTESILYYNAATKKLFRVNGTAADDEVPTATDENEITDDSPLAYINPTEGFRLMSGVTSIYTIEPKLLGNFMPEPGSISEYEYYGVPAMNGTTSCTKYGKAAGSKTETGTEAKYDLTITLTATDDAGVVRIGGFLQRGYVYATIDAVGHTLTIPNGSPIFYGAVGSWKHGNGENIPANRVFRIFGCTDSIAVFSDEYYSFNTSWKAKKVTNIGADIVLDYNVDEESGIVSIKLQKPFVLYSNEFAQNNDIAYQNEYEAEAYWVYKRLESKKLIDKESGGAAFILPETLGKYSAKVYSVVGSPGGVSANMVNNGITISRLQGVYDYVLVDGLYPGVMDYPVVGMITADGEEKNVTLENSTESTGRKQRNVITLTAKKTKYKLTILGGQLLKEVDKNDLSKNFFLYYKSRGQSMVFDWYSDVKKTIQPQKFKWISWANDGDATIENKPDYWYQEEQLQVSHLNCNIGTSSPGFYLSDESSCTLTRIGDLDDGAGPGGSETSETIIPGSKTAPHTVSFHKDMFAANIADFSARLAALAPAYRKAKVQQTAPILNITASTADHKRANTMLVCAPHAQTGFNRYEDAPLIDASQAAFTLGSLAGEQLVGINVAPDWNKIPLFLTTSATLTFQGIDSYDGDLYLFDAVDSTEYLLSEGKSIFLAVENGQQVGRWFIRSGSSHSPQVATELPSVLSEWTPVAWNPHNGMLVVRTGVSEEVSLSIYDMSGKCMERRIAADLAVFNGLNSGSYLVQLISEGKIKCIKITIK